MSQRRLWGADKSNDSEDRTSERLVLGRALVKSKRDAAELDRVGDPDLNLPAINVFALANLLASITESSVESGEPPPSWRSRDDAAV
jgi:hypothetical protein